MELRPYQLAAVQRIREQIRAGRKNILVVAPTGAGKTVIGAHILHQVDANYNHGLFVAHRREIIHQTSDKLTAFDCPHAIFMSGHRQSAISNIQVVSIATFQARKRNDRHIPPRADVIMIDEAHRSVARGYQELRDHYPDAILIGLTATPVRGDGRGLGGMYDTMVEVDTVEGLVERGYLVNTKILAPTMPDLTGVRTRAGDFVEEDLEELLDNKTLVGNVVDEWMKHSDRKTVVFSSGVGHSKHLCEEFRARGIRAEHIDGETPTTLRDRILADLSSGKVQVVTNCNVLTEGWDCPTVSCAVLVRPTKSYGLYLQMAGRILRPAPGKQDALIIDHGGSVYRHGFPEEAGNWSLDPDQPIQERQEKEREERQPTTCRNCFTVYTGRRDCPSCGWVPTTRSKALDLKEGRLVEVKRKQKKPEKEQIWNDCLWKARYNNLKVGAAAHMYRKQTGVWPRGMPLQPKGSEWKMTAKQFLETRYG